MSHEYPVPDEPAVPADPYGAPHPSPTPPPRARRRPSGWWFVAGGALILLAIGTFAGLLFRTLNGFMENDGSDEVVVTCSGADGARVLVGPTPHVAGFVGGVTGSPRRAA